MDIALDVLDAQHLPIVKLIITKVVARVLHARLIQPPLIKTNYQRAPHRAPALVLKTAIHAR